MKKYIIRTALLAVVGFGFLTSCDEDTVTYGGSNFVSYDDVSVTNINALENGGVFELPVYLAFPKSEDVVITFEVTSDVAQPGVHYEVLTPSSGLVIPAGETQASIRVNIIDNDILDDSKSLQVKLLSVVEDSSVALGMADEASTNKKLLILNNDCTTNFFTWVGDLKWDRGNPNPGTGTGTGTVNSTGDCNVLLVDGGFGYGPAQDFPIEFAFAPGANAATGTVVALEQLYCQECYDKDGVMVNVLFKGTGSYNSNTKKLIISGECTIPGGSFGAHTIVFEPAGN